MKNDIKTLIKNKIKSNMKLNKIKTNMKTQSKMKMKIYKIGKGRISHNETGISHSNL